MLSIREKIRMLSIRKKIAKSKSTTPPNKTLPSPVFSIPELLEQILYHTEPHDLLSLQGIKKTFQGVIQSSRSLQRKLFFDVKILPEGGELAEVKWNPFIQRFSDDQAYNPYGRRSFSSASFERLGYPKASWKDMFITCPATNSLAIYGGEGDGMFYLTSIAGITLGQLAKAPKQYYYLRIDRLKGFWAAHKPFTVGAAQRRACGEMYFRKQISGGLTTKKDWRPIKNQNLMDLVQQSSQPSRIIFLVPTFENFLETTRIEDDFEL